MLGGPEEGDPTGVRTRVVALGGEHKKLQVVLEASGYGVPHRPEKGVTGTPQKLVATRLQRGDQQVQLLRQRGGIPEALGVVAQPQEELSPLIPDRPGKGERSGEGKVDRIKQGQKADLCPARLELVGHLIGHKPAERRTSQIIRPLGLHGQDFADVAFGNFFDPILKLLLAEVAGLQAVEGLVEAEPRGQIAEAQHLSSPAVHAEEGRFRAVRLNGHERRRSGHTLGPQTGGQLFHSRRT